MGSCQLEEMDVMKKTEEKGRRRQKERRGEEWRGEEKRKGKRET